MRNRKNILILISEMNDYRIMCLKIHVVDSFNLGFGIVVRINFQLAILVGNEVAN